jgi:hypothetical protein
MLRRHGFFPLHTVAAIKDMKVSWGYKQWWESQKSATSKNMVLYTLNISQQKQFKAMKKDNKRNEENELITSYSV